MDISNIDLGNLEKEELEKVKMILDIAKVQADIAAMRENNERSRERHQVDLETAREENEQRRERHQMDLESMREERERYRAESQAKLEQMRIANDKYFAETAKLRKETAWYPYPYIQILVASLASSILALVFNRFLG